MALQKATPTEYGVDALYWRVDNITINRTQGRATWTLEGYASKAVSDAGGSHLSRRVYDVSLAKIAAGEHAQMLGEVWTGLATLIYTLAKSTPAAGASVVEFADGLAKAA